jgi:Arc/MetJ-type ribon-helix-helix transcriptional regulator
MAQVQVRMPEKLLKEIDKWIAEGRFASRSDAIKTIVAMHEEKERTRKFYEMLLQRSKEAKQKPGTLTTLDEAT